MNKNMKKLTYMALSTMLALSNASIAFAGAWGSDNKGTYYQDDNGEHCRNGWYNVDNKFYYFNNEGYRQSGWISDNGNWYLTSDKTGEMLKGWQKVNNNWYYLQEDGKMLNNGWNLIGNAWYFINGDGSMHTGWLSDGTNWYYLGDDGAMKVGKVYADNSSYFLNDNTNDGVYGAMKTGWVNVPDDKNAEAWYYFRPGSGEVLVGDQIIDGKTYNFAPNGLWLSNVWYQNKFYTEQKVQDAYNKDGTTKKNSEAVTKSVDQVTYMNKNKNKKDKNGNNPKPSSDYKKEVKKALGALPDGYIELYFSKAKGSITSYFEDESMRTVKYKVYDEDYDPDDEDTKNNYETESYESKYKLSGNKIMFCGDGTNVLKAFGRFTDEYVRKNDDEFKKSKKRPSETDEFAEIYSEEIDSLTSGIDDVEDLAIDTDDAYETVQAYFDSCWALYIVGNESFRNNCPRSYAYIENIQNKCMTALQK